jgi:hypothetical protein
MKNEKCPEVIGLKKRYIAQYLLFYCANKLAPQRFAIEVPKVLNLFVHMLPFAATKTTIAVVFNFNIGLSECNLIVDAKFDIFYC